MESPLDDAWKEIDYDAAWTPFDQRFAFRPNYNDRLSPAIDLSDDCLVVDLEPVYGTDGARYAAGVDAINAAALNAFVRLAGEEELIALDWQHTSYRWSPSKAALLEHPWRTTVAPDGDYYAHMTQSLSWGTFGHPWQQSLTIWGDALIQTLGAELLTWLPRHRQSHRLNALICRQPAATAAGHDCSMKAFTCRVCSNPLYFENSVCVVCKTPLGFSRGERALVPVDSKGRYVDHTGLVWWVCSNLNRSGCTWLAPLQGGQCFACDLTRVQPEQADENYLLAERAKRALVVGLDSLGFPIRSRLEDPVQGLAFDLLSSVGADAKDVVIGHDRGIITIDLAESDSAYREKVREALAEPYRTMLGHFRHEVGHYFEWQLVVGDLIEQARTLFGDETTSYADAVERHYSEGAPAGWRANYISTYATMHPFEDFAETFAHYLHICDTIESAGEYGLVTVAPISAFKDFRDVVTGVWIPLATALNVINRSMGKDDLYPFVIPTPVLDKLDFVARLPR